MGFWRRLFGLERSRKPKDETFEEERYIPEPAPFEDSEPDFERPSVDLTTATEERPLLIIDVDHLGEHFNETSDYGLGGAHAYAKGHTYRAYEPEEFKKLLRKGRKVVLQREGTKFPHVDKCTIADSLDIVRSIRKMLHTKEAYLEHQFEIVKWPGDDEYCKDDFAYVTARMLAPLKRKVMLLDASGRPRAYNDRGAFQVILYSTPADRPYEHIEPPSHIFGSELSYDMERVYRPIRQARDTHSFLIVDAGYAVAELFPNALYIHHDAAGTDYESEVDLRLYVKILEAATRFLFHPDGWDAALAAEKERAVVEEQKRFVALIQRSIPERAKRHKDTVEIARNQLKVLRQQCFDAERGLRVLEQSAIDPEHIGAHMIAEINKLQRGEVAHVVGIRLEGEAKSPILRATTDELTAVDPETGKTHLLGRFEIVLHVNSGDVTFRNLDRRSDFYDMHAPHVSDEGLPCLGSIERELPRYVATFEFEAALTLAVAFLSSANPEDEQAMESVKGFPLASSKRRNKR